MIEFNWELKEVIFGLKNGTFKYQAQRFLRPHDAIWENTADFPLLADEIISSLPDEQTQRQFLAVCLGSYLLNPAKAPQAIPGWVQGKIAISELLGIDVPLDQLLSWRWDRAAFPVLDEYENGKKDTIYYALIAKTGGTAAPLYPSWVPELMNADALEAVAIAAELAEKAHPGSRFFFWPFINPLKPTHDRSLGLPVYLSFLSLAKAKHVPMFIATGEIDRQGRLLPVCGVYEKCDTAVEKKYKKFIFAGDGSALEHRRECRPVGVSSLEQAEQEWGISSHTANLSHLKELLYPIHYQDDLKRQSTGFVGREWLVEKIDTWMIAPNGSRAFMLVGPPGIGKTAFSAWLCSNHTNITAWHFCIHYSEERKNASNMVRSLAYQLAAKFSRYAEQLHNNSQLENAIQNARDEYALFDELMIKPLYELSTQGWQPDETQLIVIDALDEAQTGNSNPIARLLSRKIDELPSWLRLVVTSRNAGEISANLYGTEPYILEASESHNLTDITSYLENIFSALSVDILKTIVSKSEGIFHYAVQVAKCPTIEEATITSLPTGINDFYRGQFERYFSSNLQQYKSEIRPLLCLVSASFESLPLALIQSILGIRNKMELSDRLEALSTLYPCTGIGDNDTIVPCHRSINEWIADWEKAGTFFVDAEYGHQLIAEYGLTELKKDKERLPKYLLAWLPSHLFAAGRSSDAKAVLKDFSLMMARTKRGLLERMLEDFQTFDNEELNIEKAFYCENAHIIRRGNDAWPAYKILLQLSVEHADDSPLTHGAEKFISDGKCDWAWLRRTDRPEKILTSSCMTVFEGEKLPITDVLVMSDGKIVSWSDDRTRRICDVRIRIWNSDGTPCKIIDAHQKPINGVLLLPDNQLISWSDDCTLKRWDSNGYHLQDMQGHNKPVIGALAFPDGDSRVLSWSKDRTLRIWDSVGSESVCLHGHSKAVVGAIIVHENQILSWSNDRTLRIWNSDGRCICCLSGHTNRILGALSLSSGNFLSWAEDNTLRLWTVDGTQLSVLEGHSEEIRGALELSDSRILSWSKDRTLRIWREDGTLIEALGACLKVLREDGTYVYYNYCNTLLWNSDGTPKTDENGHSWEIIGAIELYDKNILSWSMDGTLRKWKEDGSQLSVFVGHVKPVRGAVQLPNHKILSWSDDGTLRIWSNDGALLLTYSQHNFPVFGACVLANGYILSWADSMHIWNPDYNKGFEQNTEGSQHAMLPLNNGNILTWGGTALSIFQDDGKSVTKLAGHTGRVIGATQLIDGRILSWSADGIIRFWNVNGTPLGLLEIKGFRQLRIYILPDDQLLIQAESKLQIWKSYGTLSTEIVPHKVSLENSVTLTNGCSLVCSQAKISISNDVGEKTAEIKGYYLAELSDNRILTSSYRGMMNIWSFDGTLLASLEGQHGFINDIIVLPDEKILSRTNQSVCMWQNDGTQLIMLDFATMNFRLSYWQLHEELLYLWSDHIYYDKVYVLNINTKIMNCYDNILKPPQNNLERNSISQTEIGHNDRSITVSFRSRSINPVLYWHGRTWCKERYFFPNGTCFVSDGKISFLQIYIGEEKATVEDFENYCRDNE